jgi:hypothetical protein
MIMKRASFNISLSGFKENKSSFKDIKFYELMKPHCALV